MDLQTLLATLGAVLSGIPHWLHEFGIAAQAFNAVWLGIVVTSAFIFFTILGALAASPALLIFAIYFFDMRGKAVTEC